MSYLRHMIAAGAACVSPGVVEAQTSEDEQVWLNVTVQGPIADRLVYFAEAQPRVGQGVSRLEQLILRPAIGYRVTDTLTTYLGYAYVDEDASNRHENRMFQQVSWVVPGLKTGDLQSRTRLEQRWRSDGQDVQWRLRQMVRYEHPVARKLALLGSVEGFLALNSPDWRPRSGFDQVRTFLGTEIGLKGKSTIEAGYLNQVVDQPGRAVTMNHVLSLALFIRH